MTGVYQVGPNGITDPNGKAFRANGINCLYRRVWGGMAVDLPRFSAAALKRGFPKLNFVRFADLYDYGISQASHPATDTQVQNWVKDLNNNGVVVYAEVHNTGNFAQGQQLTDDCAWLTEWANWAKGNPMVWFGTQNESHGDPKGISSVMRAMYDAVRKTGNQSPVVLACGNPGGETTGLDQSKFADMTNTCFDQHYYGWMPSNGISWDTCRAQCAAFHNQQGAMNTLCLETGNSTDGSTQDGNWQQVLSQSLNNSIGSAGWYANWDTGGSDLLLSSPFDFSNLTTYGAYVRDAMH